ncbi:hypothetical protein [Plantactinospora sp. CA-290183]|uniref:hypothetical protein n=1 Tax=Plantactinospora sp. CA-290183 TaxID=3240006 RepID=UPI003D8D1F93
MEALGVDVGGVITDARAKGTERWLDSGSDYLNTPLNEGVIEALSRLSRQRFGSGIFLVSKCDPLTQETTRRFLHHIDFFARTGVPPENVHFCLGRKDKAPIVAQYGITHFVDDRLEVLSHMNTVPNRILFKPNEAEVDAHRQHLPHVTAVHSWTEVTQVILEERHTI